MAHPFYQPLCIVMVILCVVLVIAENELNEVKNDNFFNLQHHITDITIDKSDFRNFDEIILVETDNGILAGRQFSSYVSFLGMLLRFYVNHQQSDIPSDLLILLASLICASVCSRDCLSLPAKSTICN